jgi:ELWxxDGT repeat protein
MTGRVVLPWCLVAVMGVAGSALPAFAQFPQIVRDVNGGPTGSGPTGLVVVRDTLYFAADDGTGRGVELWKSNGTPDGTVLVKDIRPGSGSSSPALLTNVNGTLFFVATDGTGGRELWKSDGTEAGTVLVKDIYSGSGSANPESLVNVNGTLFFRVDGNCGEAMAPSRARPWSGTSTSARPTGTPRAWSILVVCSTSPPPTAPAQPLGSRVSSCGEVTGPGPALSL